MYPVGVVPFTYVTSFLFKNEGVGQTTTIFTHFVISGIGSMVVYILRIIDSTYAVGDALRWAFTVLPSFCLNNSIVFASGKGALGALRPDLNMDDFNI
jgi:ATP-binding cassette subfamily A (ABC1) protein 3